MAFPALYTIRQRFPHDCLADVLGTLRAELAGCPARVRPGMRVALAVGSRGIANLAAVVRETVDWVRAQGGEPFIVPAMGSHGGATAAGQKAVLAEYGITEAGVGAPVRSSMEVVELPRGDCALPVYCDRLAAAADATIIINRVKPHTSFHGRHESGLMKMTAIGLGKHQQALAIHARGVTGLRDLMPRVAAQILAQGNILLGIALVENAYDETCHLAVLPAAEIAEREPALLEMARARMPRLPLDDIDLLIVEEMGKNISGLGMDPNIIGRLKIAGQPEPETPHIRLIYVRDLTEATQGNATGMGLADLMARRAAEKIDYRATYANVITTGWLERGKLPVVADTDRAALEIAECSLATQAAPPWRIVRVRNTLHLDLLQVSAPALDALAGRADIEHLGAAALTARDADTLAPFPTGG